MNASNSRGTGKIFLFPRVSETTAYSGSVTIPQQEITNLEDVQRILDTMSRSEKMQLLQRLVQNLGNAFPGIESIPTVSGGEPCIVRTRIPVWLLVQAKKLGTSEAVLLQNYPTLGAEDLVNAWAYYGSHRDEIDQQIRENEEA